jgi:hypothetical protein
MRGIQEYKKWRVRQSNLPLAELIEKPNCGMHCPNGIAFSGCDQGCKECARYKGYFKPNEIKRRMLVLPEIDPVLGYRSEDGPCKLKRKDRSHICLRFICSKQSIVQELVKGN